MKTSQSEDKALSNPSDFVRYVAERKKVPVESIRVPERLLLTYQRSTYEFAMKLIDGKSPDWWMYGDAQPFCLGRFKGVEIGIGRFWIGAPAAVMTLEEVIACGAKTIFKVGLSGGIQDFLRPGNILVVTEAIRDEGTSYHYLGPETKVEASQGLIDGLVNHLTREKSTHYVGSVWSTDGVYRETLGKFRKYKTAGILGVNMETSAILALAKYRNVEAASGQVISDMLTEEGWQQAWQEASLRENSEHLVRSILEVLSES